MGERHHIGEGKLAVYGDDPVGHPEHAWQVVREVGLPSSGGLFLKTHPSSPYVFLDSPMSEDPEMATQVCVYQIATGALDQCFSAADSGRVTHFEFNEQGTEVWVSVWADEGQLVIYDTQTLQELDRITGIETPTGKFNVHNTAHDVY
jgi:nitrite reductase (NO-forming)/hydroxylamine reductase